MAKRFLLAIIHGRQQVVVIPSYKREINWSVLVVICKTDNDYVQTLFAATSQGIHAIAKKHDEAWLVKRFEKAATL